MAMICAGCRAVVAIRCCCRLLSKPFVVARSLPLLSRGRRHSLLLRCRRAVDVAGDYVHEKTPLRSVFPLTSIAPTPFDVHIRNRRAEPIYYLLSFHYYLISYLFTII
jgi:hypothetical protein